VSSKLLRRRKASSAGPWSAEITYCGCEFEVHKVTPEVAIKHRCSMAARPDGRSQHCGSPPGVVTNAGGSRAWSTAYAARLPFVPMTRRPGGTARFRAERL